jgi:hypothetical protein
MESQYIIERLSLLSGFLFLLLLLFRAEFSCKPSRIRAIYRAIYLYLFLLFIDLFRAKLYVLSKNSAFGWCSTHLHDLRSQTYRLISYLFFLFYLNAKLINISSFIFLYNVNCFILMHIRSVLVFFFSILLL